jgi:UDP:flavonoid glycosyltransferase YjiC (YdhE family)
VKVLFSARPAYGHVYPLMPLARAARDAGHEVSFATAGAFLSKLRVLGFPSHDIGITLDQAFEEVVRTAPPEEMPKGSDGRPDLEGGARLFVDVIARRTAADLVPLLDRLTPDVVVYEGYDFGAAIAAHAAGIPAVCHSVSPRMPDELIQIFVRGRLDSLWNDHGQPRASFDVFTGDCYLDIFPAVLQPPSFLADRARRSMRPIPFAEPGVGLPGWLGSNRRPLVYLTLGTIVATDDVLRPAVEGLATLDANILLALGSADGSALGHVPANVHVETFVDQAALMRHVDLVVHHGGSGTMLAALAHGTPQLVLPKGADQFWNADAMAAADLASVLEPSQATPQAVATLAESALEQRRPAVDAVREEIAAMPHPAELVDEVLTAFGRV